MEVSVFYKFFFIFLLRRLGFVSFSSHTAEFFPTTIDCCKQNKRPFILFELNIIDIIWEGLRFENQKYKWYEL